MKLTFDVGRWTLELERELHGSIRGTEREEQDKETGTTTAVISRYMYSAAPAEASGAS